MTDTATSDPAPAPGGAPRPRRSRAGRNLPVAVTVGLALAALVLGTLFTQRWIFGLVVIPLAIGIAVWELVRALEHVGARPPVVPLVAGGTVTVVAAYLRGEQALLFGLVVTVLACLAWRLGDGAPGYLRDLTASLFVAAYVPFLAGFAALLTAPPDGARRVVVFIATAVCSDVGGYAAGVLRGRHPMAPSVSPHKSWEGFAGSVVACALFGVAGVPLLVHVAWWQGGLFGLAVVATATVGDLGESLIKRDVGIKDKGGLLPGHGGLMDRLDSLLLTAPVTWLLLSAWAPVP